MIYILYTHIYAYISKEKLVRRVHKFSLGVSSKYKMLLEGGGLCF